MEEIAYLKIIPNQKGFFKVYFVIYIFVIISQMWFCVFVILRGQLVANFGEQRGNFLAGLTVPKGNS